MKNLQVDKTRTKCIRIDAGLVELLKIMAAKRHTTIKTLVEGCLAELLEVNQEDNHD